MRRIHVYLNPGDEAIPVPHVADVAGISDKRGRFALWDVINQALCYDLRGFLTIDWEEVSVRLPASIRKRLVIRQPLTP